MSHSDAARLFDQAQRLHRAGRAAEAIPLYAAIGPGEAVGYVALLGLARAFAETKAPGKAEETLRRAIALRGDDCTAHAILALILADHNRLTEAMHAAREALARAPNRPPLLNLAASIALRDGHLSEALAFCETCLRIAPTDRRALAYLPAIYASLGRNAEAATVLDLGNSVQISTIAVPSRYTATDFNAAVAEAVVAAPGLRRDHRGQPLEGGARLHDLTTFDMDIRRALLAAFDQAASVYMPSGDFIGTPRGLRDIVAWANVMEAGAFERPHIHEDAWISGVYYPEVPSGVPDNPDGGAIVFGGLDLPVRYDGPTRTHRPLAGQIVLFPSYIYHATQPFTSPGRRISIAFDVRPTNGMGGASHE